MRLVATTHDIEIRKAGFVDFKTSVTPRPGVQQRVETTLLTPEQTRIAATPAVARTKFDQQLQLMPIGRFTMGSPRREPGRRANEAQRDVEFKRAFYIGVTEVTNGQFRRFKPEHRSGIVGNHTLDLDNQPVGRHHLAGGGAVLQLAVGAGRAAACLREEGRDAGRR